MENVFGVTVHVHPVALMAIVDSHERRVEGAKRAVGTLLGVKEKRGVVVIRNAYAVPHNETEELVRSTADKLCCVYHICVLIKMFSVLEMSACMRPVHVLGKHFYM